MDDPAPAPKSATLTITRLPDGDFEARVLAIANAAKAGSYWSVGAALPDHMYLRAALAVEHLRRLREPMNEASNVAALLAMSFDVGEEMSEEIGTARTALLAKVLDDPSRALAEAVAGNRRTLGLPPQAEGCKYCHRSFKASDEARRQNPYCAECLSERLAGAAAESPVVRWELRGKYLRPVHSEDE